MRYLLAILLMFPFLAQPETITLSWDPPTTYEDGSALAPEDIKQYRVNWRIGTSSQPSMLVPGTATTAELDSSVVGTHCFTLNTIDIYDSESVPSNEACKVISAPNSLPTVTSPGAQAWKAGLAVNVQVAASDPDSDPLTFSAAGLPSGVTISTSGLLSGKPKAAGSGTATVTVSDGIGTASTTFTWTVEKRIPRAPRNARIG